MVASHWAMPKSFESMANYVERLPESCAEMTGVVLPDVPVTVISAKKNTGGAGVGLPARAKLLTAEKSGHWVQLDEPELVVAEIREMAAG
jgi:pimeloyl-ACP methyl ester carboxylesterase